MQFSKEEKAKILKGWKQSGKSATAFAKENGMVQQTLSRWAKAEANAKNGFVEVTPQTMPPAPNPLGLLIEKGGMKIHLPPGMGCSELRAIFEALEGLS